MDLRVTAKSLFLQTLHHLEIAEVIRSRVECRGETLHVGELTYALSTFRRIVVISIGKAASPLCDSLLPILGPALQRQQSIEAIVVGATAPQRQDARVRYFLGSHPYPNHTSLHAADEILSLLASCDEHSLVLFLISGGSSAMIEKPLGPSASFEDVKDFYRALVQSGLPITQMNALRKHFSAVKGGRLAVAAQRATQCTLIISDVPDNLLHIVGSGPSLPDPSTAKACREIIRENLAALKLTNSLLSFFNDPELEETAKADHPAFKESKWVSLLSSEDLSRTAGKLAATLGFHVVIDNRCDDWDYREAASYLLDRLRDLRKDHPRVCLISAGEISVRLPPVHGIGGRNQQFVLECARILAGGDLAATVLSGGSDGVDGNSPAAGAVCDASTVARAASAGLDVRAGLQYFDSFSVFKALGDAIMTGATGNNIRDLRLLLIEG